MKPFPHHYVVRAGAAAEGNVTLSSADLPDFVSAAPREFDGPGDQWSPESLLMCSVSSCLILTFRAIATVSKLDWMSLRCEAEGVLDRVDRVTRFTQIHLHAVLELPEGVDPNTGRRLLEKAEKTCLVTNSLNVPVDLRAEVKSAGQSLTAAG